MQSKRVDALKLALEALEYIRNVETDVASQTKYGRAQQIIEEILAEQPAQQESVTERFEAMHANGDIWITTIAAAAIARNTPPPAQEPVAFVSGYYGGKCVILPIDPARIFNSKTALYTSPQPPQRKPLTYEELRSIENEINPNMRWRSSDEEGITLYPSEYFELVRAIEAAHGIKKNT